MKRRDFIKTATGIAVTTSLVNPKNLFAVQSDGKTDLVRVGKGEPAILVRTALKTLGGMTRFISKGDKVVVKPNIGWDRNPAQGANTHPEVVAEIIRLCFEAGAREVMVFDNSCNTAKRCYDNSGIAESAQKAGAKVSFVMDKFFKKVEIKNGVAIKKWEFYLPALETDKYINVPVLKDHGLATITIGLKNIMGIIGGNRGAIHSNYDEKIVDLNTVFKPTLTIVDATRVLRRNGPVGGNLADVDKMEQLIAGIDPVAVDALSAELFGIKPEYLGALLEADRRGLGKIRGKDDAVVVNLQG
jgi:uncharacterized protein (DUF362 family)